MSSRFITWFMTVDSILPFFLAHVVLAIALAYFPPSSIARPITVLVITGCCLVSVRSSISKAVPGGVGGEYVCGFVFHASHFLCLARLSPAPKSTEHERWAWSVNQLFEARWGISAEILPSWSKQRKAAAPLVTDQQDTVAVKSANKSRKKTASSAEALPTAQDTAPSKNVFLIRRTWDLVWTLVVIWILKTNKLLIYPDDITSVPDGFIHRFSDVTPREAFIRGYFTFLGWVVPYCTLRAGHCLAGCLAVLCGDLPERWPPLFGNIEDAYTLRRFYALFWHHLMRKAFTSHAVFVVQKVLRLPRKSQISRYSIIILTFLISAGLHVAAGSAPLRCAIYAQTRYYFTIAAAIMIEDAVIWLSKSTIGGLGSRPGDPRTTLWHMIGYSWVVFFHIWSVSKSVFQTFTCGRS